MIFEFSGKSRRPAIQAIPLNNPPLWSVVPTIEFTYGQAQTISIAEFVTDQDGDVLTITKNAAPLPAGVTYDSASRSFIYDGLGAAAVSAGHVLIADDGRP